MRALVDNQLICREYPCYLPVLYMTGSRKWGSRGLGTRPNPCVVRFGVEVGITLLRSRILTRMIAFRCVCCDMSLQLPCLYVYLEYDPALV